MVWLLQPHKVKHFTEMIKNAENGQFLQVVKSHYFGHFFSKLLTRSQKKQCIVHRQNILFLLLEPKKISAHGVKDLRAHSDSLCIRTLTITADTLTPWHHAKLELYLVTKPLL